MRLTVSDASALPLYQQITEQLTAQIVNGTLPPGSPLPPIRSVAAELRISVISVKRAWEELDRAGLIVTAVGRGTFVAALDEQQRQKLRRDAIAERFGPAVAYCRDMGASVAEMEEVLHRLLEQPDDLQ